MGDAALVRVERDGLDPAARAAGRGRVRELVEGDDEHFEGPERVAHVRQVPEERDDDDVGDQDAQGHFLRARYFEAAPEEVVVVVGGGG